MIDSNQRSRLYSLYGLTVRSCVPLPCPEPTDAHGPADVTLQEADESALAALCSGDEIYRDDDGFSVCSRFRSGTTRVYWRDHFDFAVSRDARLVLWRRCGPTPDEVLLTYLLGQVFSYCLVGHGIEPLHATSVVVNGRAIAFLGNCGHGKSTLAAGFMRRGYPLLTDDVLVLTLDDDVVMALPSQPRLKLLPPSADALFQRRRSLPMNNITDKMIFAVDAQHQSEPARVTAMYVLPEQGNHLEISISAIEGREAVISLLKSPFNDSIVDPARLTTQFRFVAELARRVPIRRLRYPKRFELIDAVCDAILADVPAGRP